MVSEWRREWNCSSAVGRTYYVFVFLCDCSGYSGVETGDKRHRVQVVGNKWINLAIAFKLMEVDGHWE